MQISISFTDTAMLIQEPLLKNIDGDNQTGDFEIKLRLALFTDSDEKQNSFPPLTPTYQNM